MNAKDLANNSSFQDLCAEVQSYLGLRQQKGLGQRPALEVELSELASQIAGWTVSLSNPKLNPSVRAQLEESLAEAIDRQQRIEALLTEGEGRQEAVERTLDPQDVADRLNRLDEVLASNNPSLGNIELSLHIDRIDCFPDKRVVLRTCRLGVLARNAVDLLSNEPKLPSQSKAVTPRRRARLRVDNSNSDDVEAAAEWATDPNRFAGLDECWFEEEEFYIPEKSWPYQEMAIEVAEQRLAGLTHEELADKFEAKVPTIRKALKHAAVKDARFREMPKKIPRGRWHEDHALEVATKKAEGLGTNELVIYFGKSDTTIRKALVHAARIGENSSPPDLQKPRPSCSPGSA